MPLLSLKRPRESIISRADRALTLGQLDAALELYRQALDRNPNNPPIWVQCGHALKEVGRLDAAVLAYRRAISYDPHLADAYLHLGHALKLQGRMEEVQIAYLQAFALDPTTPDAARELQAVGWPDERLAQVKAVRSPAVAADNSTDPHVPARLPRKRDSLITLADRARDGGHWPAAARLYGKALDRHPHNPPILVQYGNALKECGRLTEAETAYRNAIAYDSGDADFWVQLGHVLKLQGRKDEAAAAYLGAFARDAARSDALRELSGFGWTDGQIAELQRAGGTSAEQTPVSELLGPAGPTENLAEAVGKTDAARLDGSSPAGEDTWSGVFDAKWYLQRYPDVARAGIDPLQHFLRFGRQEGRKPNEAEEVADPSSEAAMAAKAKFRDEALERLHAFLASGDTLRLPSSPAPVVSILLVLYNQAELTFSCLKSLAATVDVPAEIIIVDNASSDHTRRLLDRLPGVQVIHNKENRHFLRGVNQAAAAARGEALLLLNNDTNLRPGALEAALETLRSAADVGAVGGKLILLDGTLQEAGSIIWNDGSCLGYGRGDDPSAPEYQFRREVDYCSAAFLMVRRDLFEKLGGLDTAFAPAYYEETDFCMRLREAGYRIMYDPRIEVMHFEFGSASSSREATALMQEHHKLFYDRHWRALTRHHLPHGTPNLLARTPDRRPRLLLIDDLLPFSFYGSGFPRAAAMLKVLHSAGYQITYWAVNEAAVSWPDIRAEFPSDIEFIPGGGREFLAQFLTERARHYSVILVSRPHNMVALAKHFEEHPGEYQGVRLVYDAEALFSPREAMRLALAGKPLTQAAAEEELQKELRLSDAADAVIAVNPAEAAAFRTAGRANVHVVGHCLEPEPIDTGFADRENFLFVGSLGHDDGPNVDALFWFVEEVMPQLDRLLSHPYRVVVAGAFGARRLHRLMHPRINLLGRVADLTACYGRSRVFIAPTRFAAGIPHKLHETAARGLPAVATGLLARQLGWNHGVELLVGDSAEEFAAQCARLYTDEAVWQHVRDAALARVTADCNPAAFESNVKAVLRSVGSARVDGAL